MSGYPNPNNFNQQNYYAQQGSNGIGTGSPSLNPQVLMGAAAGAGIRPQIPFNPGMATGSPAPNSGQMTPAQLQRLAEFHSRQQASPQPQQMLAQYQQQQQSVRPPQPVYPAQSQGQSQSPALGQQRPLQGTAQSSQQLAIQQAIAIRNRCVENGTPIPPAVHQFIQQVAAAQGLVPRRPSLPPSQSSQSQPPQQQIQPHIPITQAQQSIRPALLAAAIAARASQSVSPSLPPAPPLPAPPIGVPPSALSRPPIVPVTKAFTPPARSPSPAKAVKEPTPPNVPSTGIEAVKTEADTEQEKPKPKKKKPKPKDKEKEKDGEKGQDIEKEKDKEKDKDAEEVKPKKPRPKKPRAKKEKDKDKETTTSTATATESASAVYFAAVEPTLKDSSTSLATDEKATPAPVELGEKQPEPPARAVERKTSPVRPAAPAANTTPAPSAHAHNAAPEVRRRREEGMRGSMRNEIARLMYGAGDVVEPDIDTVDYMEDLVTDFLAELSRPIPPLRSGPGAAHQPIPLSFDIVRHRLSSTPSMSKYLERFDHMVHMSDVLKAHRRIANPNMSDLVEQVGNDYLGLDDDAEAANGDGEARQNRNRKRVGGMEDDGRPKKKGRPIKNPGERKKPGPQKGWKLNREPGVGTPPGGGYRRSGFKDPNAPKRKYVRKSMGAGGVGVKRDSSVA